MKKVGKILSLLLVMIMLAGCSQPYPAEATPDPDPAPAPNPVVDTPLYTAENFPRIDASLATQPFTNAVVENFTNGELTGDDIEYTNTHPAYGRLINGEVDLIVVTEPSEEELQMAADAGVKLEVTPVVKEAFVFYVNKNNPVDSLTTEQVQKIYSGEITNWKDVGGNDEEIIAYQRPTNSGSQTGMLSLVMTDYELMEPIKETLIETMYDIVNLVSAYDNGPNAIGYSYLYYAKTMYQDMDANVVDNIKFLKINDVEPNNENIANETYPYTTAYYIVINQDDSIYAPSRILKDHLLAEEGQRIAEQVGYVPVKPLTSTPGNPNPTEDPNLQYTVDSYREMYFLNPAKFDTYNDVDGEVYVRHWDDPMDTYYDPEEYSISYVQLVNLKDKTVQENVNKAIKDVAYGLIEHPKADNTQYRYVYTFTAGNFSNILSVTLASHDDERVLNFDLNTGNEIKFNDLFIGGTPMNQMVSEAVYKTLAAADYDWNPEDESSWEHAFDMDYRDTSKYETIAVKAVNTIARGNFDFEITPTYVYIENVIDTDMTNMEYTTGINIPVIDFIDYTTMYKKYVTEENIFEDEIVDWQLIGTNISYIEEMFKYEMTDDLMDIEALYYFDSDYAGNREKVLEILKSDTAERLDKIVKSNPDKGVFYIVTFDAYKAYDSDNLMASVNFLSAVCDKTYFKNDAFKDFITIANGGAWGGFVDIAYTDDNFENLEITTGILDYVFDGEGNMVSVESRW